MAELLAYLSATYPTITLALVVVGALRTINKPLFSIARQFVQLTPFRWDNEILQRIENSATYRVISYLLDWFGSVKLK